jgi:hypothetical protein
MERGSHSLFLGVLTWIGLATAGNAQSDKPPVVTLSAAVCPEDEPCEPACEPLFCCDDCCGFTRFWVRGEYLYWWTKGIVLPPLVTTSPPGTDLSNAGVLGAAGTRVLFGGSRVNDDARSGERITAGFWLDCEQTCGIEARYFALETETTNFFARSEGEPILGRPFFQVERNIQNSLLVAFPGVLRGDISINASTRLEGAEANVRHRLCGGCCYRVDLLAGYRYLNLRDDLSIRETEISTNDEFFPVGTRFDLIESFNTRNQFHGGQVGVDANFYRGRWNLELLAKVALGATRQRAEIQGAVLAQFPGVTPVVSRGGLLAQPSNIGNYNRTEFSIVPELGVNIGYQVTRRVRVGVGYTLIYWSSVTRPGHSIDLGINTTQVAPGTLEGASRPAFTFRDSSFWTQGLSAFLQFDF